MKLRRFTSVMMAAVLAAGTLAGCSGGGGDEMCIRDRLYQGLESGAYVYFVHSFYLEAEREADVAAFAESGVPFHT